MKKNSFSQQQVLKQKLTYQNIQLFKMMELNMMQFDEKVKEELEVNPALENLDNYDSQKIDIAADSNDKKLDSIENVARIEKRGLWAESNPMAPWENRKLHRQGVSTKDSFDLKN